MRQRREVHIIEQRAELALAAQIFYKLRGSRRQIAAGGVALAVFTHQSYARCIVVRVLDATPQIPSLLPAIGNQEL